VAEAIGKVGSVAAVKGDTAGESAAAGVASGKAGVWGRVADMTEAAELGVVNAAGNGSTVDGDETAGLRDACAADSISGSRRSSVGAGGVGGVADRPRASLARAGGAAELLWTGFTVAGGTAGSARAGGTDDLLRAGTAGPGGAAGTAAVGRAVHVPGPGSARATGSARLARPSLAGAGRAADPADGEGATHGGAGE
jgi:hypothetical protein